VILDDDQSLNSSLFLFLSKQIIDIISSSVSRNFERGRGKKKFLKPNTWVLESGNSQRLWGMRSKSPAAEENLQFLGQNIAV